MKIVSDHLILDVKAGRKKLAKAVAKGERIPVTIKGTITGLWGMDDGVSQEFIVSVEEASS